jgi:Protein of unknown function (DUF3616)
MSGDRRPGAVCTDRYDRKRSLGRRRKAATGRREALQGHSRSTTDSDWLFRGERKSGDLDGEVVAYALPYFYIAGSHGCSRHSNKFHSSAFILARIPENQVTTAAIDRTYSFDSSSVATTYRLSEALAAISQIRPYFTRDLMSSNGLNVEGLAVAGGKLFAGLRAPTLGGTHLAISVLSQHGNIIDVLVMFGKRRTTGIQYSTRVKDRSGGAQSVTSHIDGTMPCTR